MLFRSVAPPASDDVLDSVFELPDDVLDIMQEGTSSLDNISPQDISKLTPEELKQKLPPQWSYNGSPDGRFVHIKDSNGQYRIRIDPPDKVTEYPHIHIFDSEGNALDINGKIVPSNSPDAHIPR